MRRFFYSPPSETSDDGSVTIKDVVPGKYEVTVNNVPKGTYVQSITYGSQEILHKALDLSGGAGGELRITLRYGVAELDGTVVAEDNSSDGNASKKVNALVYVIPDEEGNERIYSSEPDQNAMFSKKELPPGKYHALAVEGVDYMAMGNPDLRKELASRGVEVELKENEKKSLQLQVLTASDVQQIYARLGIEAE
jgi:hypothetical protein